jgi:import inner membrane translocase subunit TIM54
VFSPRATQPILVASGTDYVLKIGTNPGGLARTLIHEIRGRRITKAANELPGTVMLVNDAQSNVEER